MQIANSIRTEPVVRKLAVISYNVTAWESTNCIVVPGLTRMLPAVTPRDLICAVCAVVAPRGCTLAVFTATLLPFALIEVSAMLSGADPLPGLELARDAVIFPVTAVPAFNTVAPLATTS